MADQPSPGPKVFCIGFHKTGTTTMRDALRILGYRVTGPNGTRDPDIAEKLGRMVDELAEQYDAFQDNPWPLVYERMDARYPGSKFILTVRDPDRWIASNAGHFQDAETPMRRLIYGVGSPQGNEKLYMARMQQHNEEVLAYFKDRPDDLLVFDVGKDGQWEALCDFLGKPVPPLPFPHANQGKARERRRKYAAWGPLSRLMARLERLARG